MDVYLPKTKFQVPEINHSAPAINLNIPIKALGTSGEDSCEIVFR